jgi:transcription initiation factor TFIIIB Brf1 subunit/transcription initiation factor TFIIB
VNTKQPPPPATTDEQPWEPIPYLPIFEREARLPSSRKFESPAEPLVTSDLYRFAYANCGFTREEVHRIGEYVLANLAHWSKHPVSACAAQIYLLGMLDGCRISRAQIEIDRERVEDGKVM